MQCMSHICKVSPTNVAKIRYLPKTHISIIVIHMVRIIQLFSCGTTKQCIPHTTGYPPWLY